MFSNLAWNKSLGFLLVLVMVLGCVEKSDSTQTTKLVASVKQNKKFVKFERPQLISYSNWPKIADTQLSIKGYALDEQQLNLLFEKLKVPTIANTDIQQKNLNFTGSYKDLLQSLKPGQRFVYKDFSFVAISDDFTGLSMGEGWWLLRLKFIKPDLVLTPLQKLVAQQNLSISSDDSLLVKARENKLKAVESLLRLLDVPKKLVLIEAWIVEVDESFAQQFGFDFSFASQQRNTPATQQLNLGESGVFSASSGGFGIGVNFGKVMERSKLISHPRLYIQDGGDGEIFQGSQIPYSTSDQQTGARVRFELAGLRLQVSPQIRGDERIFLKVEVSKDSVPSTETNPTILKRRIKTDLILDPGQVGIVGGLKLSSERSARSKQIGGVLSFIGNKRKDISNSVLIFFISATFSETV